VPAKPPPKPAAPPDPADLPHPLTFFLTSRERTLVLRALRHIHANRARALLLALNIKPDRDQ
jgi:hypothetical protein